MADILDTLASELPEEYLPFYLAELVRAFCGARGLTDETDMLDYWQEAVIVAAKKLELAKSHGADSVAYVKRGVQCYLIDLNRKLDVRRDHVSLLAGAAEGEEETAAPMIEDFARSAFDRREVADLRRLDDFNVALYATIALAPELSAYWRAYAKTSGSNRAVAKYLGVHRKTVAKYHRRIFFARFEKNYRIVRQLRGRAI